MKVECVGKGFVYTWPGGQVTLEPGKPIDLPEERANRLLKKAGNRVRLVLSTLQPGDRITWTRADGTTQHGTVDYLHTDADRSAWAFVIVGDNWVAVNLKFVSQV